MDDKDAEIQRLRQALAIYADPANWDDYMPGQFDVWTGDGNGYEVAQAALATPEPEEGEKWTTFLMR